MKNEAKTDVKFDSTSSKKKKSPKSKKIGHKHVKARKLNTNEKITPKKQIRRIDDIFKKISTRRESERDKLFLSNRNLQEVENSEKESEENKKINTTIQKKINGEKMNVVVENKGKNEKDFNSTIDGETEEICKKINTTEAEKIKPRNDRKLLSRKCLEIKKERRKFKRSLTEKNDFGLFRSLRPGLMLIADQD